MLTNYGHWVVIIYGDNDVYVYVVIAAKCCY